MEINLVFYRFDLWFHDRSIIFPPCSFVCFEVLCPLAEDPSSPGAKLTAPALLLFNISACCPLTSLSAPLWEPGLSDIAPLLFYFFIVERCRKNHSADTCRLGSLKPARTSHKLKSSYRSWEHGFSMPSPWFIIANQPSRGRKKERREKSEMCLFELCVKAKVFLKKKRKRKKEKKSSSLEDVESLFNEVLQHDSNNYVTWICVIRDNMISSVTWVFVTGSLISRQNQDNTFKLRKKKKIPGINSWKVSYFFQTTVLE